MSQRGITELKSLLLNMDPYLSRRQWCFQPISDPRFLPETAFAMIREEEGVCVILPAPAAADDVPRFARISLKVHSDLEAVGLTAAVSAALAEAEIPCNAVAGLYHDHLFVPWDKRKEAFGLLEKLGLDAAS